MPCMSLASKAVFAEPHVTEAAGQSCQDMAEGMIGILVSTAVAALLTSMSA